MSSERQDTPWIDPLAMDTEAMRRSGYAVVDAMLAWINQPDPVIRRTTAAALSALLPAAMPERGQPIEDVLGHVVDDVLPYASKIGHPGYFAYIPGSTTWPAALATFMTSVTNVYAGTWMEAAGASYLELCVLEWFRQWVGMPPGTSGVLVSGGSAANLTALAAARELRLGAMDARAILYCADQAHSSVGRSARVLGFRPDQVRVVPSDDRFRMRPDALAVAIAHDRDAGRIPLAVIAAGGSTNTGAVDPLPELADLCAQNDVWLHVDAAYGGFGALCERGARALTGLDRADSVTLDPHKWLQMPLECGALLVREPRGLERAFAVLPDYLVDAHEPGSEVDFCDRGLQLSRSARSVPVWAALSTFGVDAFRAVVDHCLDLVDLAEDLIVDDPALELMNPASLGIVCFRRTLPGATEAQVAQANLWLAAQLEATGTGLVSTTRLHGRFAVRMCVLNHRSDESDVRRVLDHFAQTQIPESVLAATASTIEPGGAFVESLSEQDWTLLREHAVPRSVSAGSTVLSRWATDRDFYVILQGQLTASIDGEARGELNAGEFFGEIAASDWGSGYGPLRNADVIAETDCHLLVVPPDGLMDLMSQSDRIRDAVLAVRARRLAE